MKKHSLKPMIFLNLCAIFLSFVAPMKWLSPLSAAYCAAAGWNGQTVFALPGTLMGCMISPAGLGGAITCVLASLGGEAFHLRMRGNEAILALWACVSCLLPALIRYAGSGLYPLSSAVCVCMVALAAVPVWVPVFARGLSNSTPSAPDERIALHFLAGAVIAGACRMLPAMGLFGAGALVLLLSRDGISGACVAAFTAGLGLLLGDMPALPVLYLFLSAGTAGLGHMLGRWAQSILFLSGLLFMRYLDWNPAYLWLFGASAVLPILPEYFCAAFHTKFLPARHTGSHALRVIAACAHQPINGQRVSGDCSLIQSLPGDRILLAMADGMGTGLSARRASECAIRECARILRSGLDDVTAYRALNRLTAGAGSTFSTLETCVIDLSTGHAAFHKSGSETAWVVHDKRARRVKGASLPLGVLSEAPPTVHRVLLQPGDLVLLVTDGLVGALGGEDSTETLILAASPKSPREICAHLINTARKQTQKHPDDMSVLCARIAPCAFSEEKHDRPSLPAKVEDEQAS